MLKADSVSCAGCKSVSFCPTQEQGWGQARFTLYLQCWHAEGMHFSIYNVGTGVVEKDEVNHSVRDPKMNNAPNGKESW